MNVCEYIYRCLNISMDVFESIYECLNILYIINFGFITHGKFYKGILHDR